MATPLPTDTDFAQQWHLNNTAAGQYDLNVVRAWNDYTGVGIKVLVMDGGFDYAHSDLASNYNTAIDFDYPNNDDDPSPVGVGDNHGTAVMGIIGAARNGTGVVGVAYDATLIGARLPFGETQTADTFRAAFAGALGDAVTNGIDVVNLSFNTSNSFGIGDLVNARLMLDAIGNAVENGRDGLGLVIVKSAANAHGRDVNHTQVDSNTQAIVVAAVNRDGFVSSYSSYGPPVLISAFGSPTEGEIVTTDRTGADGYNASDTTSSFNGTSAAAPMIAGVAALILDANESLGWRDVQAIFAYSARHVGSPIDGVTMSATEANLWSWNGGNTWNGGGLHYSADYGYGLVDALAAVRLAESWRAVSTNANQKSAVLDILNVDTPLLDGVTVGTIFEGTLDKSIKVERVEVSIDFQAPYLSDMDVYLTGPNGREQLLVAGEGGSNAYDGVFTMSSQASRGELSNGGWSVRMADSVAGDVITVRDIKIEVFGAAASKNDTYIYTNEFSDFLDSHSKNLKDKNGGDDLLNAAAVTAAMTVDLGKGKGTIDGVDMKIKSIEDVFGGDGKDRLTGNKGDNDLAGGRGADQLTGGKGGDSFIFHVIADSFGGNKHDLIKDFGKGDEIDLRSIDTKAADGDQTFKFIGDNKFHDKIGELRIDITDKQGTRHDVTIVEADLTGDGITDFMIELTGAHHLKASDFDL